MDCLSSGAQEYLSRNGMMPPAWQTQRRVLIVANTHGKIVCKCGNVLARCRCIEHSNTIAQTVNECERCRKPSPTAGRTLKDIHEVEEK